MNFLKHFIESSREDRKTQQDRGNTQTSLVKKTDEFSQALYPEAHESKIISQ